jgi:hypothetical protein
MLKNKKLIKIVLAVLVLAYYAYTEYYPVDQTHTTGQQDNSLLLQAIANRNSDVQVTGAGKVIKVLPDDNKGSRHQRFLVKLESGNTLLIAHNIDLAPRVKGLKQGDQISFNGEFEWNSKGGVIHWTHKDPRSVHIHGWLEHNGEKYW